MKDILSLQIGQTILIITKNKNIHEEYLSKIENIEKKYMFLINPFDEEKTPVKKGDILPFFVLENNEIYNFQSRIEDISFSRIPRIVIEKPKEINLNFRRITIRFPLSITVKYEIVAPKTYFKNSNIIQIGTALAKNISVGGILLETSDNVNGLKNINMIKLHFTLPAYPILHLQGKISRIKINNNKTEFVVSFIEPSAKDKENIIKYIFNSQKKYILDKTLLENL